MEKDKKLPLTVNWPASLLNFVRGPLFDQTRVRVGQITELAMIAWLKENGYWEQYEASLAEDIL